jgi:hypothetical protein
MDGSMVPAAMRPAPIHGKATPKGKRIRREQSEKARLRSGFCTAIAAHPKPLRPRPFLPQTVHTFPCVSRR